MRKAPEEEFTNRVRKVQERIAAEGLDALIVHSDMRYIGGGDSFYLSNYRPRTPSFTEVIVPRQGEPTLVMPPGLGDQELAKHQSWIKDVRGKAHGQWGADWPMQAREILEGHKLAGGKIGISGIEMMSLGLYRGFQEAMPKATLVDAIGVVQSARNVKSHWEMEVIREANRISDAGLDVFMAAAKPGMRHAEAIGEAERKVRQEGADDCVLPMGASMPYAWGMHRGEMRFEQNDVLGAELNGRLAGYYGQVCRTRFLGTPTREQQRGLDVVRQVVAAMAEQLKPGVAAQELWEAGMKPFKAAGYEYSGVRWGHGMGLTIAEHFNIGPGDTTPILPNYYVMLHASIPPGPYVNVMLIDGDSFLITDRGNERLTSAKQW